MSEENELPEGWLIAKLGDIASPGGTWNPYANSGSEFFYVDIEAVDNTAQRIVAPKRLPVAEAPSRARMAIRTGDVIFSLVRPYLKNIAIIPLELDGQVASTAYCVMRPETGITSSYIFYAVLRKSFIDSIKTYGNSPPSAHDDEFFAMSIPLAPTNEQRRIVAAIEQQFSRLDVAVASLQHAKTKLKRQRAAILKAAVEGTLTEDWRAEHAATESASQLLARILGERRAKWEADQLMKMQVRGVTPKDDAWKKGYKEQDPPDTKNLPELPEEWCWTTVEQLTPANRPCAYGVLQPGPEVEGGVPLVRVGDINDGRIYLETIKRIDPRIADQYPRTKLEGGEVLITLVGAVGRTAVVPNELAGANIARAVAVIPLTDFTKASWVEIWFRNPAKVLEMISKAHEVARKTLNLEDVRDAFVAIPPFMEQKQIVSEVEARISIIARTETEIEANLKRAERLRQTILAKAFAGHLVPQEPNDEPATVLLERIGKESRERRNGKGSNGRFAKVSNEPVRMDVEGVEQVGLWERALTD